MNQCMRAKIRYYLRFVFGLSRSESLAFYSIIFFISFFICYELVRGYVEAQEEAFDFRPVFWSGELAKIPKPKAYVPYVKGKFGYYSRGFRGKVFSGSDRAAGKRGLGTTWLARGNGGKPLGVKAGSKMRKAAWALDINQADSLAWVGLQGIGPGFAKRILGYRERLGGFYAVDQLKEVYGLDSMWVEANRGHLLIGGGIYKKIALNRVTWNEFRHPYVSYAQVKIFLAYRKQHPFISDFQSLESIKLLDLSMWKRLRPYLSFEP